MASDLSTTNGTVLNPIGYDRSEAGEEIPPNNREADGNDGRRMIVESDSDPGVDSPLVSGIKMRFRLRLLGLSNNMNNIHDLI